ncbi:MAG: hypothetical protein LBI55_04080 [Oscillospiraceae bacterium]|jgi:hypothetical protein|nr:hypothetical protein [Oscillospiraceae bacterium]
MIIRFKKITNATVILVLVSLIFLGAHIIKSKNNNVSGDFSNLTDKTFSFCKNATVRTGKINFDCEISRTPEGITNITIISPETIKGMKFAWLGDRQEINFDKLTNKTKENILPISSLPCAIYKVLNHASKLNGKSKITSSVDNLSYSIELHKDSDQIKKIKIPSLELIADFS